MSRPAAPTDPVRRLAGMYRPGSARLWLAAFLGALALGCSVALMGVSAWLISRASQQPPILYLQVAVVSVRAFGIGRGVFRYAERLVSHQAALRSLVDLRVKFFEKLIPLAPAGLPAYRRGDLLRRMVDDVDAMADLPLRVMLPAFSALLVGTGTVAVTTWLLPGTGAVMAACLLVGGVVVPLLIVWSSGRAQAVQAPLQAELSSQFVTSLSASPELTVLGADGEYERSITGFDAELTRAAQRTAAGSGLSSALGVLAQGAAILAIIAIAVPAVRDGRLPGVNLAVVVLLPLAAYECVAVLAPAALSWIRVKAAAARLVEVIDAQPPVSEPAQPRHAEGHRLQAEDISAAYPGGSPVLQRLSFTVDEGARLGLVGPSGGGKSTVLNVLAKFLDYRGQLRLGDAGLVEVAGADARRVVLWTPQTPHVFDSVVSANLRVARPDADDETLRQVLRQVGMADWGQRLEDPVGPNGAGMSGGERQRLGLARVLLADEPVVLLDEPTEHLDPATAAAVLTAIDEVTRGRSLVVVTHQTIPWLDEHVEVGR